MADADNKADSGRVLAGSFADRLRFMRSVKNLSSRRLGVAIGVSYQTVVNWETGKSEPTVTNLVKLARALGCSLKELAGDSTL